MSEILEIEYKTLVSKEDFIHTKTYFQLKESDFFTQTNYYFDTSDFLLKNQKAGLRIRLLNDSAELTLKVPQPVGLMEITDYFSRKQALTFIEKDQLPEKGHVAKKMNELGVPLEKLHTLGHLKTKRAEKKLPQGLLALDENWYNQRHDFELELEVTDAVQGKQAFLFLLETLGIQESPSVNKVQRMMQSLNSEIKKLS